jgi:hypothetical protein
MGIQLNEAQAALRTIAQEDSGVFAQEARRTFDEAFPGQQLG